MVKHREKRHHGGLCFPPWFSHDTIGLLVFFGRLGGVLSERKDLTKHHQMMNINFGLADLFSLTRSRCSGFQFNFFFEKKKDKT